MPDYTKKLQALRQKRQEATDTPNAEATRANQVTEDKSPAQNINAMFNKEFGAPAPVDPMDKSYDTSGQSFVGDQNLEEQNLEQGAVDRSLGEGAEFMGDSYVDSNSWSPSTIQQGLIQQAGRNIMYGAGKMIGSWGDVAQVIGSVFPGVDMYDGNPLSKYLQSVGNEGMNKYATYIPEEVMNPEFKFSTFANPEFWTTHGAQFVPQIAEILMTMGAAKGIKAGGEVAARKLLGETLEAGAESAAKRGLKATTKGVYAGAHAVEEVAGTGRGALGSMLTDTGKFTNSFGNAVENVAGGMLTNLRVSLSNAGEIYNTYKDMKDANGEAMFDKGQLSSMAAGAFLNNMQYMALDIASWGMTFGNGWSTLGKMGIGGKATLNNVMQQKVVGGLFSKSISPIYTNLAKLGGKAVFEGLEETIQETWEDWSKIQAYKDVHGTTNGYDGVTKNHDNFWDYYMSQDSEATRAVSFGVGGLAGGSFNMKTLVNKSADDAHKMYSRSENLKQIFEKGSSGRAWQDHHIRSQMSELIFDNKEAVFNDFIGGLTDNAVISEEQAQNYGDLFTEMKAAKDDIVNLNIVGKKSMMMNVTKENDLANKIEIEKATTENNIAVLQSQMAEDPEGLKTEMLREQEQLKKRISPMVNMINQIKQNKISLLKGHKAKNVQWDTRIDDYGKEYIVEVPQDEDLSTEIKDTKDQAPSNPEGRTIRGKAKELLDSFMSTVKGFINPEDQVVDTAADETPAEKANRNQAAFTDEDEVTVKQLQEQLAATPAEDTEQIAIINRSLEEVEARRAAAEQANNSVAQQTSPGKEIIVNPKVISDDTQTELTPELYQNFVNEGDIPSGILDSIANKIANNELLSTEEQSIQAEFGSEIESNLQERAKIEKEMDAEVDAETDNEREAAYLKKAAKRKGQELTLEQQNEKFEQDLSKRIIDGTQRAADDEVFGNPGKERRLTSLNQITDYATELFSRKKSFVENANKNFDKVKSSINTLMNQDDASDMDSIRFGQQVAINEKLDLMFPDSKVSVTAISNLNKSVGPKTMGYTIAGAIYIDERVWEQDNIFMHEMLHVYYDLMKNDPNTKVLLDFALRNEKVVADVLNTYDDQIQYLTQKGVKVRKGNLFSDEQTALMDKEEKQKVILKLIETGRLIEIPIKDQDVIAEEIFAMHFESPTANNFNKFFEPRQEPQRQHYVKNWWRAIKTRAVNAAKQYPSSEQQFLTTMNDDEQAVYTNAKQFIFDKFQDSITGNDISAEGKARKIDQVDAETEADLLDIRSRLNKSYEEHLNQDVPREILDMEKELDDFDAMNDSSTDNFFEARRTKYIQKASKLIRDFSKNYNKTIRRRYYMQNRNKPTNWKNIPYFDKDKLQIRLFDMARNATSNYDFIRRLEKSNVEEIFEFNEFLNEVRDDKELVLSSMYFIYKNQSNMNSVISYIDAQGNFQVQNNLSNKEQAISDNILDKTVKSASAYFNSFSRDADKRASVNKTYLSNFTNYVAAVKKIKSGVYTQKDLYDFLKFFTNGNVDLNSLMAENRINIDGRNFTIDTVVNEVISKALTKKGINNQNVDDFGVYDYRNNNGTIKPIIRKLIQSIVATNRKFTADYTVQNAIGNQEPVRDIDNFLTREFKNMEDDAMRMGRNQFIGKYSNISAANAGEGSRSNAIVNYIFDQVQKGNKVDLNKFNGIRNENNNTASTIKESNSTEQSINEFLTFISTGANKDSYLMETGRYSDSPTSYVLRVPKMKIDDLGKFTGDKFGFNAKSKAAVVNAFNTYKNLKGDMTMDEFTNMVSNEIDQEINFLNENNEVLLTMQNLKPYVTKGKLNENGKNAVAEYVSNQIFNGIYYSDIFFPSFNVNDLLKRAKSGRSPGFSLNKNVQVEPLYFIDEFFTKYDQEGNLTDHYSESDSGIYVLREDAERLQKAGGNMMRLNNAYKILMTGVEHNNPSFKGKNMYDKGYATILDDAVVGQNPKLKGLYELMKNRREKYVERHGTMEQDLQSGIPTHFLYAAPVSSNKSNNFPQELLAKQGNVNTPTETGSLLTLDALNTLDFDAANEVFDNWYYDDDNFLGLSGENFVVQQIMDKETAKSNTPVQMVRAILTNASVNGTLAEAEDIQRLIVEQQQEELKSWRDILENGSAEDVRQLLIENMLLDDVDPTQRFLIVNDKLSMNTPALRELARNTLSNAIRLRGNKLETPGTVAKAKAPTYQKSYGSTNGTKNLAFYTKNSDGSLSKGEAVLPSYMAASVRPRKVLEINKLTSAKDNPEIALDLIKKRAADEAKSYGVSYGPVYSENNNIIGYYVEGDTVIATRIPSHGPQTTGVFEVIDFDTTGASDVQLPSEFSVNITGGDFDGDQFFIQHKAKRGMAKWNEAFKKITKYWLSPQMAAEVMLPIDFKDEAESAIKSVEKIYGKKDDDSLHFSPRGRRSAFNNTLISKGNIGTTANLHSLIGMMSAYNTPLTQDININGRVANQFTDSDTESRTINSAKIFNIILDNTKYHYADKLGINEHTASSAMLLRNLGYTLNEVGIILNSPVVQEMNKLLSKNENVFNEKKSIKDITETVKTNLKLPREVEKNIKINTNDILSADNQNATLGLMTYLGKINEELMAFSAVMQGHNKLENNPFLLQGQLDRFNEIITNANVAGKGGAIEIPVELRNNPLVQNYLDVFNFNMDTQRKLDPVFRPDSVEVFGRITNGIGRNMSNDNIRRLHNDIELFQTSRLLGMNNIPQEYMNSLVVPGDKNIYDRIGQHISTLQNDIIQLDTSNPSKSISALDNSLLFNKGLRYSLQGNQKYISLNNNYFNENLSNEERQRMIDEFNELPNDIKNDLVLYDLFHTGWKGPQSLFHIFEKPFKSLISSMSSMDQTSKNEQNLSPSLKNELTKRVLQENPDIMTKVKVYPFTNEDGNRIMSPEFIRRHGGLMSKIAKGEPTFFVYEGNQGSFVVQFNGWSNAAIVDFKATKSNEERKHTAAVLAPGHMEFYPVKPNQNKIGVVSIPDQNSGKPFYYMDNNNLTSKTWDDRISEAEKKGDSFEGMERREIASDYYNYTDMLSYDQFNEVMGFGSEVSKLRKQANYNKYLENKRDAEEAFRLVNYTTVKTMSTEELLKYYGGNALADGKPGYGHRDKIAYAKVIRPIIMEIANRNSQEQSAKTNKFYEGKDLGFFQSYLMSNNIPSNQPEIQALVRKMEVEYKKFIKERNKYVSGINQATDDLYKEQFGYAVNHPGFKDVLKSVFTTMFSNRERMYQQLYGQLITFEEVATENGTVRNMKYKTRAEVEAGYANNTISPAQYHFYNTTQEVTDALRPFALSNGQAGRADYIPHTAPAWMEIFARRGMLGLAVNSKTIDERIYDVTMSLKNPVTGEMEDDVPFKVVEDWYNTVSKTRKSTSAEALEYTRLKKKAIQLYRSGKNENGSPIQYSNVEVGGAIGDVFMDRFSKSRSISATDLPSLDLNKAFVDYTHSVLFSNGNGEFMGMKQMLPLVDGVLATAESRGDTNAVNYVDKVWKQYFLSGNTQKTLPSTSGMEAVGLTTDKVVDYLTKASLIYWLGWKGLAVGTGAYALGNVLVGKYQNIRTAGIGSWAKGESRFWNGIDGKFNILDPFKGVRDATKILKKVGFMDINVFDDVNVQSKNSLDKNFTTLALLPMIWSEKWIQGVDFLGRLSNEEWNSLTAGGELPVERLTELENEVKNNHGKGYQATDQRMIQMYSWGKNMLQFSRYLPTMFYDQFAQEDINIYGRKHMGNYTALGKTIQKGIRGDWSPKTFMQYRRGLDSYERSRLDSGLIGFGMLTALLGVNVLDSSYRHENLIADANPLLDFDKLASKTTPPSINMLQNLSQ